MRLFKSRKSAENISSTPTSSPSAQSVSKALTNYKELTGKTKSSSSSSSTSSTTSCLTVEHITTGGTISLHLSSSSLPDLYDSPANILSSNLPRTQANLKDHITETEMEIDKDSNNGKQKNNSSISNNTNCKLNELQLSMTTSCRGRRSLPAVNTNSSINDKKHSLPTSAVLTSSNILKEFSCGNSDSKCNSNANSTFLQHCTNNKSNKFVGAPVIGNKSCNNGKDTFLFYLKCTSKQNVASSSRKW